MPVCWIARGCRAGGEASANGDLVARLLPVDTLCVNCGFHHDAKVRHEALRRALPAELNELRELHPCWWGGGKNTSNDRQLYRDLNAIGAASTGAHSGVWRLKRKETSQ